MLDNIKDIVSNKFTRTEISRDEELVLKVFFVEEDKEYYLLKFSGITTENYDLLQFLAFALKGLLDRIDLINYEDQFESYMYDLEYNEDKENYLPAWFEGSLERELVERHRKQIEEYKLGVDFKRI